MTKRKEIMNSTCFKVVLIYLLVLIGGGFYLGFEHGLWADLWNIFTQPAMLLTDFFVVGSAGAALVNAGLVGLIGLAVSVGVKVPIRGPIIAGIFTMVGFSMMGKTVMNIIPIFIGVWLYARLQDEYFHHFILNALFGTALAPLVSTAAIALEFGVGGGLVFGGIAGFLVPPLAAHLLGSHQGMNLYNIGFTAGFIGTLFAGLFRAFGPAMELQGIAGVGFNEQVFWPLVLYLASMIGVGMILNKGKWEKLREILDSTGALVSDFVTQSGLGATLINMGLVGLIGTAYVALVGGSYNGLSISGIFTMVAFGAFGKHPRNILPIMVGAALSFYFFQWDFTEPGAVLGVLFGTTLAPIAGSFGIAAGLVAGFLHISMVMNVGFLHGGLNLYNNGFSGGLVATIMVGVLKQFPTQGNDNEYGRNNE